jgi:hypothetical protein
MLAIELFLRDAFGTFHVKEAALFSYASDWLIFR